MSARYMADLRDEVRLVPFYGCRPFTPQSTCRDIHPGGPPARGSMIYVECCSRSGADHLRCMHRDPSTDPKPEKVHRKGKFKGGRGS
jgi:hypothetical protein